MEKLKSLKESGKTLSRSNLVLTSPLPPNPSPHGRSLLPASRPLRPSHLLIPASSPARFPPALAPLACFSSAPLQPPGPPWLLLPPQYISLFL